MADETISVDAFRAEVEELETRLHHRLMAHPDAREGVVAYLERRPADWRGSLSAEVPDPPDG